MTTTDEVVIVTGAASRKNLKILVEDEDGIPVNVSGGTFRLQAHSDDITTTIDQAGVVTDGPNGVVTWAGIGAYVTIANLGTKPQATFTARWKFTDASSKVDYGPAFQLVYVRSPLEG